MTLPRREAEGPVALRSRAGIKLHHYVRARSGDVTMPPPSEVAQSMAMTRAVAVAVATTASSELVSEASRKAMSPSR